MLVHVALQKQYVFLRIYTAGDVLRKLLEAAAAKQLGVLAHGERVQVCHEVIAVKLLGSRAPVFHRAEVVSEVQITRGLDARQHYFLFYLFHFYYLLNYKAKDTVYHCTILLLT